MNNEEKVELKPNDVDNIYNIINKIDPKGIVFSESKELYHKTKKYLETQDINDYDNIYKEIPYEITHTKNK